MARNWLRSWGNWTSPLTSWRGDAEGTALMAEESDGVRRFGCLVLDRPRQQVRVRGELVHLTAMEMAILELLASHPGMVFTNERIAEACHHDPTAVQVRSVKRRVQSLRQKLGDAGLLITNERGVGYSLRHGDELVARTQWWSFAALAAWWTARGGRGKAMTAVGVVGLVGVTVAVGGWAVYDRMQPPAGTRGVTLRAAAAWRPPLDQPALMSLGFDPALPHWSGVGSAIAYTGVEDRFLVLSDRGYENGAADRACRWHTFRISVPDAEDGALRVEWLTETLMTDEAGVPLRGSAAHMAARYDPEAMRLDADGNVWIAEEYGPSIDVFAPDGRRVRCLAVPARYRVDRPYHNPDRERGDNVTGRTPNRGFEALALDEASGRVFAVTQSPLIQDGGENGRFLRLLELPTEGDTAPREWVYPLDRDDHQVSDMLLVGRTLYVLERDTLSGPLARFKRLYAVDLAGATDVSRIASLPPDVLPAGMVPLRKTLAIDLRAAAARRADLTCYEQFEGVTLGPRDTAGRVVLFLTTDNATPGTVLGELMNVYALLLDGSVLGR